MINFTAVKQVDNNEKLPTLRSMYMGQVFEHEEEYMMKTDIVLGVSYIICIGMHSGRKYTFPDYMRFQPVTLHVTSVTRN